jgi:hypothetical protein
LYASAAIDAIEMKKVLFLLAGLALGALAGPALADSHVRLGVSVGVPLYTDPYYPGPYYYPYYNAPPRIVVVPTAPPTYIERGDAEREAPASAYWYYCAESKAYYPYVKHCPGGWQRVTPQPPQ